MAEINGGGGTWDTYLDVVERDTERANAAIELVLAQPSIGSALVDNLNASIHLRTLLTDIFLMDSILKITDEADDGIS